MRLIDADALTKECGDWYVEEGPEEGFIGTLEQLLSGQPETNCSEIPNNSDTISRQAAIDAVSKGCLELRGVFYRCKENIEALPSAQPERKTGYWILDRSGKYCCNRCMEPCASYVMMKPRDKFCKMCGSRNEVME